MALFYYASHPPTDVFVPKEHTREELDALLVAPDKRDSCANNFAEFKKCILVQHQTKRITQWKHADQEYCGYYFDHWNYCRQLKFTELGLISTTTQV
ncbi:UNKNOWN [Stylonychia lemnae]|uniref:Uncharacterized protein n=1 Tax=Stylonychia lemnae TaxID=5949 RepID=A0A078AIC3_STYLE|nr:UNKNOWN [Stylonychia lemnae]|eukprot:CDW80558.1 UNKNOWN [Stylonychia lemnae]